MLRSKGHYIDREELKKMYSLYHLYDYYNLMYIDLNNDTPMERTVMKYAKKCVDLYRELDVHCSDTTTNFCKALNAFKKKYENTLLKPDIIVDWDKKFLPPLSISKGVVPEDPVNSESLISTSNENGDSQLHKESLPSMHHNKEESKGSEAIVTTKPLPLGSLSDSDNQMSLEAHPQNEENNKSFWGVDTNKITGTAVASLGASSIFFLFYKFTSFGSRFFKGRSKNNIRNDFNKQRNIPLDSLEYQQNNPTLQSYNVAYDSI
ncbi:unnamed protein product [Plasmodium vivax]|uniref:(malaria parasite P. vivax) hypothetical protein n=1 Tax=Plasmodium vivax TaxID=5855 RepID=A0A8S4H7E8_PLAVI|nr:unnamed protein product [Plasmodium vivax]